MNSSPPFFSFVSSVALTVLLAACTGRPSAEEVVDRSSPAICEKARECAGDATFAAAYPGGVDECVTRTKSEAKKKYGDDLEKSSVCTDEELDACLQDLKAKACPANATLPSIPCDC